MSRAHRRNSAPAHSDTRAGRATMARLLEAAAAIFAEVGYDAATMRDIAARRSIDRSLYQFFPNKEVSPGRLKRNTARAEGALGQPAALSVKTPTIRLMIVSQCNN